MPLWRVLTSSPNAILLPDSMTKDFENHGLWLAYNFSHVLCVLSRDIPFTMISFVIFPRRNVSTIRVIVPLDGDHIFYSDKTYQKNRFSFDQSETFILEFGFIKVENVCTSPMGHHQQVQLLWYQEGRNHLDQGTWPLEGQEITQIQHPCQPRK